MLLARRRRPPTRPRQSTALRWLLAAVAALWLYTLAGRRPLVSECAPPPFFHGYNVERYSSQPAQAPDRFTLVLNTFRREDLAKQAVDFYSGCGAVHSIRVIWCEEHAPPEDRAASPGEPPLRYDVMRNCSLNNRFLPIPDIETEAILSIDDDIRIPCEDLEKAFQAWRSSPRTIVGFFPRLHLEHPDCRFSYLRTFDTLAMRRAYSIVLTKAAFLHRDYLAHYSYGIPASVRHYIEEQRNCEDLAMQFAVAIATGLPPRAVHSAR
eukprot:jgi/Tetstr1/435074/TSEL_024043.t1